MNIKTIIDLTEKHILEELILAEEALVEEQQPAIDVPGIDEGEQLTHIMSAVWCKQEIRKTGCDTRTAVRQYTQKVRNSIS
jgi:hypothetical protein